MQQCSTSSLNSIYESFHCILQAKVWHNDRLVRPAPVQRPQVRIGADHGRPVAFLYRSPGPVGHGEGKCLQPWDGPATADAATNRRAASLRAGQHPFLIRRHLWNSAAAGTCARSRGGVQHDRDSGTIGRDDESLRRKSVFASGERWKEGQALIHKY